MSGLPLVSAGFRLLDWLAILLVLLLPILHCREIPEGIIEGLQSEAFAERESAQERLLIWATGAGRPAITALGESLVQEDEPEVKHRVLGVLRCLSDEDYLRDGAKGYLGIRMEEIQVPDENGDDKLFAVLISSVLKSTPAELAGLMDGDVIVRFNGGGWKVNGAMEDFRTRIGETRPGEVVNLVIRRGDGLLEMNIPVGRSPVENLDTLQSDVGALDKRLKDEYFDQWLERHGVGLVDGN